MDPHATALDTLIGSFGVTGLGALFALGAFVFACAVVVALRSARALTIERRRSQEERGRVSLLNQALRNQFKFTNDLVDSIPVAIALRDRDGMYLFANRTWKRWFGEGSDEIVGTNVRDRLTDEVAERVMELDRVAFDAGPGAAPHVSEIELAGHRYSQTRSVMTDEKGEVVGLSIATIDITERHVQEQQLRDQMLITRAAIDDNPNAMYLKDTHGRYLTVNDAWCRLSGVPREKAIGRDVREVFADEQGEKHRAVDMQLIEQGEGFSEIEARRTGADGKPVWLIVRKAVLKRADGEVIGLIGTNTDITRLKQYETELADRNKFITEVIETLPVSVAIRDVEGRFMQVNRTWERYFNRSREEVVGKRFDELGGWTSDRELVEVAQAADRADRAAMARGPNAAPEPMELQRRGRFFLNTRRALVDTAGRMLGVVAVSLDITDQKMMAEVLSMEQRRLALVVRAAKAGIVDWDGRTHATYYSPRFREILGYPPDADTSKWPDYFKVLLHPEDRQAYTAKWQAFLKGKGPGGRFAEFLGPDEHRLLRKDGTYIWVEVSGVAVRNEEGWVTRWIAATTDIHDRKAQESILATTLENMDQGITMTDRDLRIIAINRRFLELLDFPADKFGPGKFTLADAFRYNAQRGEYGPGNVEEQVRTRVELAKKFQPHHFERKRPDGRVLSIVGKPLPDDAGFVTTYTDVTEQKRAEEELKASVALREEVERMSRHDLKTPIHSVIAVSRMLRDNNRLEKEDAELLATVERAGYRILNMVNLSLDLFRMEQGTYEFHPQPVDLDEVASKVATDLQGQAASKNVEVRVTRTKSAIAMAEELLCYSIFANLVKNAIEAAPEASTVSIELDRDGDLVFARVHNAGTVPEHVRERFFQKYATAGKSAGLGLGTYSANLLATVQGGELSLSTSAETGTTLTLQLKAANAEDVKAQREAKAHPVDEDAMPELPPLRVLVADDDEFNRIVLKRDLPSPPLKLSMAVNGRAAVDIATDEWPDVVLLDLEMPVMDGYQAARRLRELERTRHRKRCLIVAISSNDEEVIVQRALKAGCDHYLVKPAPREVLWRLLAGANMPLVSGGLTEADASPADEVVLDPDLKATLAGFLQSRREALDEMPLALEAGARDAFRRLAHRLAGSFALYGFRWAAMQAKALERDAAAGDAAVLAGKVAELRRHLDEVKIRVGSSTTVTMP